jgi:hypothetical protein
MGLKVSFHIHAIVKYSNDNNFGVQACSVENYMAALTKFSVSRLYVVSIFTYLRLASKKFEGIVKLLQVFISLSFPPFPHSKSADLHYIFLSRRGKQIGAH